MGVSGRRRDPAADARALPDLLGALAWTNDDNGEALERVRERWLREGDLGRVELVFAMDDVFPGRSRDEVLANMTAGAERFPQFREKAAGIVEHWDRRAEPGLREKGGRVFGAAGAGPGARLDSRTADEPGRGGGAHRRPSGPHAPPKFPTEIFDELLPCLTADAQAEIHAACDAWSAGRDECRAAIAAWMEVPGGGRAEADLERRRAEVIARFPRVAKGFYTW